MYHITRANMEYAYEVDVSVSSGGDEQDALNRRSLSAKEPRIIGLFFGNTTIKNKDKTFNASLPPCR